MAEKSILQKGKERGKRLIDTVFKPSMLKAATNKISAREKRMQAVDNEIKGTDTLVRKRLNRNLRRK